MIVGFKQKFPDGTLTHFVNNIYDGLKIHTIRAGERWKPGMVIHMATGVRTKYYWQFNKGYALLSKCISTQRIFMRLTSICVIINIDGKCLDEQEIQLLIKNDGLTTEQFAAWFFPGDVVEFSGQIIHWTDFKY